MIADLRQRAKADGNARLVFAYEASSQGFGLYDQLAAAGIEAYVVAPTKIARSARQEVEKTDERDALDLLELLRGHILAGNRLPAVWIPDAPTRDDRELVRTRLDVGEKITAMKAQVQSLLKRCQLRRPSAAGKGWTKSFYAWLQRESEDSAASRESPLGPGGRTTLASLLRQLKFLEEEEKQLDEQVERLAWSPRYEARMRALTKLGGVGVLTAIVFLTELGDLSRFANRRQIASYLGLSPTSHESGKQNDRKGHITHQGSARVRKVLCQATWSRVRCHEGEKAVYERIALKNPKKKKIAVVASMRRLAICMWHRGCDAEGACTAWPTAAGESGTNRV
jgi:transposase